MHVCLCTLKMRQSPPHPLLKSAALQPRIPSPTHSLCWRGQGDAAAVRTYNAAIPDLPHPHAHHTNAALCPPTRPLLGRDKETRRLYALKMQQRPLPPNTVELTYNEITVGGAQRFSCLLFAASVLSVRSSAHRSPKLRSSCHQDCGGWAFLEKKNVPRFGGLAPIPRKQ